MTTEVQLELDESIQRRFGTIADDARVTQKIVSDLDEGLRRINDYSLPIEDARAQEAYGVHSAVNKVLIVNREIVAERITVVLVDEALGF
jgi:hypothetical protein